ncbi:hypothetical protein GCM10010329_17430 [Streptomyces spiroverticillatus]|uniref:Collagen-like protein n=1 Tax=Streptomyces finlayi TaxID=67296 RepID=A0A918WTH1_9ACTN|nr:collagen-like protein [Streptomyces finlayi]GGZ96713.1 hypothetical protein GCM10010329_17430 [Streptomyces spiroverticillatus]GHC82017.1 hypothetical protein GCM10010334_09910 [Streptomyces finlayi]
MLPEEIPTVVVSGRFLTPDGRPLSGAVTFRAPGQITFSASDVILGGPVVAQLDAQGQISATLPATDSPGMDPGGWSYTVTEALSGIPTGRTYSVLLPRAQKLVDLADIAPTDPSKPNYIPVPGIQGPRGEQGQSAYQVAVAGGFNGTPAAWLASLVGPRGATGATGAQGPQGVQGVPGKDGAPGGIQSVNGKTGAAVTLAAADVNALATPLRGAANGVASLDAGGKLPTAQLPAGASGVTSVNGKPGPAVSLTAADVGAMPSDGQAGAYLFLNTPTPEYRGLAFQTGGSNRWVYQVDNQPEGANDSGSNFELAAWTNANQWKSTVLYSDRSTGNLAIGTATLAVGAKLTVAGALALRNVAAAPAPVAGSVVLYAEAGVLKVVNAAGTRTTLG